jgi:hypothetical protein
VIKRIQWLFFVACCSLFLATASGQGEQRIIPGQWQFQEDIQSPSQFAGHPLGSRHWPHSLVVEYMRYLGEHSERAEWQPYARSHGGRELGFLTITSAANQKRTRRIQTLHRQLTQPKSSSKVAIETLPAVIQMGYGVHGDESSATHASLAVAYLLSAGLNEEIESWLDSMVIRIDPSLNPDGFNRFSHWVNENRGVHPSRDSLDREHRQPWPGGRVNYYWFDLNRDWLPAVHPESQGRLREFHFWKPDVVLDFHEMGTSSTYFFQPGVPKRTHPLSPQMTRELTRKFADYHAKALDDIDSLYFTEERFDDFYPGKGSTYPDLHGAVGILFEQASARGNVQESVNGDVYFWKTIRNQVATSLSSLRATHDLREPLLKNKREAYDEAIEMAAGQEIRAFAFSAADDRSRLERFANLLKLHDLEYQWLSSQGSVKLTTGESVELAAGTLLVPADQPEYRMLRTIVDRPTTFEESIFYDVSAWTLPLAYDLNQFELAEMPQNTSGASKEIQTPKNVNSQGKVVAYAMHWTSEKAAPDLWLVQSEGFRAKVATESFVARSGDQEVEFSAGTIVLPIGIQTQPESKLRQVIRRQCQATWIPLTSGLSPEGIDLGSGGFETLSQPRVLLVTGNGMSRYDVGALWHWFDTSLQMPVTMAEGSDLGSADWSKYNVVVLAGGGPEGVEASAWDRFSRWIADGGTVISIGTANQWLAGKNLVQLHPSSIVTSSSTQASKLVQRPYSQADDDRALELLSGIIVEGRMDLTHPLCWGQADESLPQFRNHKTFLKAVNSPYSNPVLYAENPLMAGYASEANLKTLQGSASVSIYGQGRGRVIAMAEMPGFRGFFRGSMRLFDNAVFFGPIIEAR